MHCNLYDRAAHAKSATHMSKVCPPHSAPATPFRRDVLPPSCRPPDGHSCRTPLSHALRGCRHRCQGESLVPPYSRERIPSPFPLALSLSVSPSRHLPPSLSRSLALSLSRSLALCITPSRPVLDDAGRQAHDAAALGPADHVVVAKVGQDEGLHHLAEQHHAGGSLRTSTRPRLEYVST